MFRLWGGAFCLAAQIRLSPQKSKLLSLNGSDTIADLKGKTIAWKDEMVKKLSAIQSPEGSWVNKNNQFWEGDPVLVTCYAILSLEYAMGMWRSAGVRNCASGFAALGNQTLISGS